MNPLVFIPTKAELRLRRGGTLVMGRGSGEEQKGDMMTGNAVATRRAVTTRAILMTKVQNLHN